MSTTGACFLKLEAGCDPRQLYLKLASLEKDFPGATRQSFESVRCESVFESFVFCAESFSCLSAAYTGMVACIQAGDL